MLIRFPRRWIGSSAYPPQSNWLAKNIGPLL
jgi:hypothetical protein